jgi:tRNA modification GTPase
VNSADAVLLVEDMSQPGSAPVVTARARVLRVGLKSDLAESFSDYDICVSAVSGDGLKYLCLRIEEIARQLAASVSDATPSRMRQSQELEGCRGALLRALAMVGMPLELRAEELRIAGDRLSRLVGRIGVEDLLDVIFSKFCVGK